jgi:prevent-host-death family protein
MKRVNIDKAEATLSTLLTEVEQGEEIIIVRNGMEIAWLTRIEPSEQREPVKKPVEGAWLALPGWKDFKYDPAIFAPLTDKEMEEEGWI